MHVKQPLKFPKITKDDITRANDLFRHYLFFDGAGQIWTTCCNRHEPKTQTLGVLEGSRRRRSKTQTLGVLTGAHRELGECPFCGKPAMWYNKRYGRKGLTEFQPCLFLHKRGRVAFGNAVWLRKEYTDTLTPSVYFNHTLAYRFAENKPQMWINYYDLGELKDWFKHRYAPFSDATGVCWFRVIGMERIKGTCIEYAPFAYASCGVNSYLDLPKLLMIYCNYPQIEMLYKMGLKFPIDALMNGIKNKYLIDWTQTDPRKAFHLNGAQLRELLAVDYFHQQEALRLRKQMQKRGYDLTITEAAELCRACRDKTGRDVLVRLVQESGKHPRKILSYFKKQFKDGTYTGMRWCTGMRWYRDYRNFCDFLGYDMTQEMVLLPPDLQAAHDRAAEAAAAIKQEQSAHEEEQRHAALAVRRAMLAKKYTFSHVGFLIRPPVSAQEIVDEGKTLVHCVGGYANRYAEGRVTILFLRNEAHPEKPLATIEMNGNQIVQVHGYRNEREACPENPSRTPARELYKSILDPWLAWLKGGSKRDKDGTPKLPKRKGASVA